MPSHLPPSTSFVALNKVLFFLQLCPHSDGFAPEAAMGTLAAEPSTLTGFCRLCYGILFLTKESQVHNTNSANYIQGILSPETILGV